MDISAEVIPLIGQDKSSELEYIAVLPPSRIIAQLISSFSNADGGYIVLGVAFKSKRKTEIIGLSEDFHAHAITHKAIDMLSFRPEIIYQYVAYHDKKLFVIKVARSTVPIKLEGKIYKRVGPGFEIMNTPDIQFRLDGYAKIKFIYFELEGNKKNVTDAMLRLLEHYQSILKIMDDLARLLYPSNPSTPTDNQEGKILSRILFSSFVDNFETYLSDLLYEIFLAHPVTLKSKAPVSIEDVLNCSDLQEFVKFLAKQKIGKLQRGSVKGFISETKQISDLGVLNEATQNEIEKILQIRHLYSHRNGIVDEKFLQFFAGQFVLNEEHQMHIEEVCNTLVYLSNVAGKIDLAAIGKFKLAMSR